MTWRQRAEPILDVTRVIDSLVQAESRSLDREHIVCVYDSYVDALSAYGPFDDPVAAVEFAAHLEKDMTYPGCDRPPSIQVLPLEAVAPRDDMAK
jgi:hypothetical protein